MSSEPQNITVFGAGVIGLSTALTLSSAYPSATLTVVATHFPGDRSIDYCSPWAGANWSSMATDNGPLEHYDRVTFNRFNALMDGDSVHGCKAQKRGEGNEAGLGRMGMWAVFDTGKKEAGVFSVGTGKVWYEELVGGIGELGKDVLPEDAEFGMDIKSTFRINTQVYLQWLQAQALARGVKLIRRKYASITSLLGDLPATDLLVNCTGIGSLHLTDVRDANLYPTRGQTLLVAEPKVPINRMYLRSQQRIFPTTTYVFPRPLGGGVICGGSRQDNDWSAEWDEQLGQDILKRCCELCPELGKPQDLQVIARNIGLRPSRKGGPRIEAETGRWKVPVVHCYGHSGTGYQSSWGTAERVLELVQKTLSPSAKL
ncbi:hypothetical protein IAQ61_000896 [Plenodomus lingam]|uniref:uncharacterized protein n=1 Tax=Leptosphaeria maculans TaxID=5022 RepID=UPI00332C785B|nr:hypothetical protein IAQ61_000896 [Plenodomus lingam]